MIVDGYNILNAWHGEALNKRPLADSRDRLIDTLFDYAGYSGQQVTVVFDAWRSDRMQRTAESKGPVSVVYTQKAETADHYIERLCDEYARDMALDRVEVRVATSDFIEQTVVLGRGATRISARELLTEVERMRDAGRREGVTARKERSTIMDGQKSDVREKLERMRRGI